VSAKGATLVAISLAASLHPGPARAEGAIALGLPADVARQGVAVGWTVRQPAGQAQAVALRYCRSASDTPLGTRELCLVVRTFVDACVAVALDPGDSTPGFGWAVAATKAGAEAAAMRDCRQTAGADREGFCRIDVSDCDHP
jgi:hypothetical protein